MSSDMILMILVSSDRILMILVSSVRMFVILVMLNVCFYDFVYPGKDFGDF